MYYLFASAILPQYYNGSRPAHMEHQIFINPNNIIEVHLSGDITFDDVNFLGQQAIKHASLLEDKGYQVNILMDYAEAGNTEALAVPLAKTISKNLEFHKIACINSSEENTKIIEEVAKGAKVEDRFLVFKTRAEAEAWLSE